MTDKDCITCPFCGVPVNLDKFNNFFEYYLPPLPEQSDITIRREPHQTQISFVKCYSCNKISIYACRHSSVAPFSAMIYPLGSCLDFTDYAPPAICEDYREASFIIKLSPKSAATLCRRCIQGMIRDHWNISAGSLAKEIELLKPLLPDDQWHAIDNIRKIGNIGAHMEKDVSVIVDILPEEAECLLELIEYLIHEWYVLPRESSRLYNKLFTVGESVQKRRRR